MVEPVSASDSATEELAQAAEARAPGRISISMGLWSEEGVIPAGRFNQALIDAATGGAGSVSITPVSLMTQSHWEVLEEAWAA